jgi:hypothetical protein
MQDARILRSVNPGIPLARMKRARGPCIRMNAPLWAAHFDDLHLLLYAGERLFSGVKS